MKLPFLERLSFTGKKVKLKNGDEANTDAHIEERNQGERAPHPFWVIVQKEMADQIRSWRFVILFLIILLTCLGSLYTALTNIRDVAANIDANNAFLFLRLFTISDPDGTLPPFITFISFLGPLLGIALGFDAINAERNRGTLSRIVSQPIQRDYLINAKYIATLIMIAVLIFTLGFLVMAFGILATGLPPTWDEFWRIIVFMLMSIVYIGFWLNLSILFSIRFKQPATSAISCIAIWLFFGVFYSMIVNIIGGIGNEADGRFTQVLSNLNPNYLFSDITTILLTPSIRSVGPLTMEQVVGAIPSTLPLGQSLLLIWPQLTGLIAATLLCFALSYVIFMRQEIRA
ncbi:MULTISPECIES: ABC transporter permease [Bacillaceae]|uniref:ABC transporter permease n=1 Tax=Evansella alkalicola TaxID=745819 RepID=A0ABS6JWH5_9BACI|nr:MULTISPECIES: ABC transporter permease [Bacillaceae]MBU9722938.1 ABC transporter permease [Bacillus alkalicola]